MHFTCPEEKFEEKRIPIEKNCSVLYVHWSRIFGFCRKIISANWSKQHSTCPGNFFLEKLCGEQKWREVSWRDVKNHCHQQRYTEEVLLLFLEVSGFEILCLMQASRSFLGSLLSHSNKSFCFWDLLSVQTSVWQRRHFRALKRLRLKI